jgi:deazaflavin-dependent oxidoreductase (nitroreductase family)
MASNYGEFQRWMIQDFRQNQGQISEGPFKDRDVLLLTTNGARSGDERTLPLVYSRDGDRIVIVASKGGAPTNPHWYHNLVAHPEVTVEVGPEKFRARAMVVDDEVEYERLYGQHSTKNPGFIEYRRKTSRRIPVVLLNRVD